MLRLLIKYQPRSKEGESAELGVLLVGAERLARLEQDGRSGDGQHRQGDLEAHARREDCAKIFNESITQP